MCRMCVEAKNPAQAKEIASQLARHGRTYTRIHITNITQLREPLRDARNQLGLYAIEYDKKLNVRRPHEKRY